MKRKEQIEKALNVNIFETELEEAKKLGVQAMFGEKYGKVVRVVDMDFSKELCGGTHVANTSLIEKFAIVSIESKGSGIFRVEASTNTNLYAYLEEKINNFKQEIITIMGKVDEIVKKAKDENQVIVPGQINIPTLTGSYQDILTYRQAYEDARRVLKDVDKEYEALQRKLNAIDYKDFLEKVEVINGINTLVVKVENQDINSVKDVIDNLANQFDNCVIFFAIVNEGKIIFVAKSKGNKVHCGYLVKTAAVATGGNGGGRPDFAQAGGKDASKIEEALQLVLNKVN